MRKLGIVFFAVVALVQSFACNKKEETLAPTTIIEVTVKDGNSWSASNTSLSIASGATIYLYATQADVSNNTPKYTATTDQSGIAKVPVDFLSQYFLKAQKGNAKNMVNGLLIVGIFQSQAEIQSSPVQTPTPTSGSPKYLDTNQDGRINSNDQVIADWVEPKENQNVTKTVIIYQ